jgi:ferric-dicitrate binding protein FerR (iron transport regulator)
MRQPATMRDAKTKVKERLLDRRVDKLSEENDKLREAVEDLRQELDAEHGRSKETLSALSKSRRRPGRMKWLVLAGGAYVLGAKAGRARYEQMKSWVRSMTQQGSMSQTDGAPMATTTTTTPSSGSTL